MTSQRCTRRSLPNYLVMTSVILLLPLSLECETKDTNLTLVNERQNNVTSCTKCSLPTLFLRLFHWMSINLGQFVFLLFFNFLSAERFFFQIRVTGLKFNKRFFFKYRKYFIRQRWLPVTEGHLTPTSPEAFPHNASLYVIINYPDRWRYYLVTW
jgi:hypothetical protein